MAALIVSSVGFIFACIPGAVVVGWVLLPIGFILGIVSLFAKGKGKALGIAGVIVSVVGTVVAAIVFFAIVATSLSSALGGSSTVIDQPAETTQSPSESDGSETPAAAEGSRDNPIVVGATISSDRWTVVVNSFNPDGSAAVAEGNQFNKPAPAGSHYVVVNYTVTYTGTDSSYAAEVGVDLVTDAGNVVNSYDNFVVLVDSIGLDELFTGASTTGSAAFLVADGENALIRVRPGIIADEVFVKA